MKQKTSLTYRLKYLSVVIVIATACMGISNMAAAGEPNGGVDFTRDIRPILSENCFVCHGPEKAKRKAKLRLDVKESVFKYRGDYAVIVPGDLKKSELWHLITSDDEEERMPPKKSRKKLTSSQKLLIKRWIEQGAQWAGHWAYETPTRPALTKVKQKDWPRNPIDHFVLSRLEQAKLAPEIEASRRTWIRRVTFDLTGLPPTVEQANAFINDKSASAYEKVVDRLLASPAYGEHMTRYWLDVARYGDTHGLHLDNYREIWPYRDWVIKAFNTNKPFNTFIIEQLAGDLLPNPSIDQRVATGFNRCHVTTSEGGSIKKEVYTRNVLDRVSTLGTVFMGTTLGCAVCHDHKFDPFTQKDFYSLFAFVNSLDGNPLDGNRKDHAPVLRVPSADRLEKKKQLEQQLAKIDGEIRTKLSAFKYVQPKQSTQPKAPKPREVVWIEDSAPRGAKVQANATPAQKVSWDWITKDKGPVYSGKRSSTHSGKGLTQHYFDKAKATLTIGKGDTLFAYVYLDPKNPPKEIMLQFNDGSWEHRAYWGGDHINWGSKGKVSRRPMGKLPKAGEWVRLEVSAQHVGLKPGAKLNGWAFTQFDGKAYWDKAGIVTTGDQKLKYDSLVRWISDQRKVKKSSLPAELKTAIKLASANRGAKQRQQLKDYFIEHVFAGSRQAFASLHQKRNQIKSQITGLDKGMPTTLIWKETAKPRPAFILKRGEYDQEGAPVTRATPPALPPMPVNAPKNRLGLAKWLTMKDHPLTARVTVNRFWQQLFGTGIVKTSEDFGSQGEPPSHPKLLNWLAVDFVDSGWNVKQLMKKMVLSASYRQASILTPLKLKADPHNRLISRGPRFRLDAEMMRDQSLFLSGMLINKVGGPSVKPPQPKGLWFSVGYSGSNTVRFKQDVGEKTYRRSMYTFWKRTAPPPQMSIIDAPSRESCTVRRERTNTPLLALLLMNEQQFFEAARRLGELAMKQSGNDQAKAAWMFERAAIRKPSQADLGDMLGLYRESLAAFKKDAQAAKDVIGVGDSKADAALNVAELAAWTMVGNLVLNLDEVINKN